MNNRVQDRIEPKGQTPRSARPLGHHAGRRHGHCQRGGHSGDDRRRDRAAVSPAARRGGLHLPLARRIPVKDVVGLGIEMDIGGRRRHGPGLDRWRHGGAAWTCATAKCGPEPCTLPSTVPGRLLPRRAAGGGKVFVALVRRRAVVGGDRCPVRPQPARWLEGASTCGPQPWRAYRAAAGRAAAAADGAAAEALVRRTDAGTVTRVALLPDNADSDPPPDDRRELAGRGGDHHPCNRLARDPLAGDIRAMTMDRDGNTLYAGTNDGRLVRWQLDDEGEVAAAGSGPRVCRRAGHHRAGHGVGRRFAGRGRRPGRADDLVSGQCRRQPASCA